MYFEDHTSQYDEAEGKMVLDTAGPYLVEYDVSEEYSYEKVKYCFKADMPAEHNVKIKTFT